MSLEKASPMTSKLYVLLHNNKEVWDTISVFCEQAQGEADLLAELLQEWFNMLLERRTVRALKCVGPAKDILYYFLQDALSSVDWVALAETLIEVQAQ